MFSSLAGWVEAAIDKRAISGCTLTAFPLDLDKQEIFTRTASPHILDTVGIMLIFYEKYKKTS